MEIRARQKDNVIILDLSGRIDVNAATFVEVVGQCLRDGSSDILCNFSGVDFIDYMGISALVLAYKEVANCKGRMKISHIPAHLKGLFCVAGLDRSIDIYATDELALASFKEDKIIENIQKLQLRRRFKRLPIDMKIEIKTNQGRNPVCLKGELINLSGVGAYIFGCGSFKLGDACVLKLKLPPRQEELEIEGRVVWLPDKQVQPHMYPGIGVEFHNISTSLQQRLLDFIEKNLSRSHSEG